VPEAVSSDPDAAASPPASPRDEEVAALRARVAALEAELVEQAARCNAALAAAQERVAWLDRLDLDLDRTLARPPVRLAVLGSVGVVRRARRARGAVRRRLGG
jgi:hypothetical protein